MSDPDYDDDIDDVLTDLDDPDDVDLDEDEEDDPALDSDEPDYADPDSDADEDDESSRVDAPAHIPGRGAHPYALDDLGTPAEQRAGHSLDERLAREEPDVFEEEGAERDEDASDPAYDTLDPPDVPPERESVGPEQSAVHGHPDTDDE
jgi:hypothetical protein